jgi:chromosome segregation ATPase
MKKLLIFIIVIALVSCQQDKSRLAALTSAHDSLTVAAAEKDSAIIDFLMAFNEIQENLDSIKTLEKMITVASQQPGELRGSRQSRIIEDIALLNQLIQRNKELNASLQGRLSTANSKIGELQGMVTEFDRMVSNMNAQINQKNAEIDQLTFNVQRLSMDVGQLTTTVDRVQQEVAEKSRIIDIQTVELNKVYYALGTVRELTENSVLEKAGGVLGIGRTLKIRKDFNREYFTEADKRGFTYLPVHSRKVRVVSVHPPESYRISGEKSADTIFVLNPEEFWKASRYLLLVVD